MGFFGSRDLAASTLMAYVSSGADLGGRGRTPFLPSSGIRPPADPKGSPILTYPFLADGIF